MHVLVSISIIRELDFIVIYQKYSNRLVVFMKMDISIVKSIMKKKKAVDIFIKE